MTRIGFEYALLRVMPRIERGEFLNVGVLVYAQTEDHLSMESYVDEARLLALDPTLDVRAVEGSLAAIAATCVGGEGAGAAAALSVGQRFRWLSAPRSTMVQPGPVHTGMTDDIAVETLRLLHRLVVPRAD